MQFFINSDAPQKRLGPIFKMTAYHSWFPNNYEVSALPVGEKWLIAVFLVDFFGRRFKLADLATVEAKDAVILNVMAEGNEMKFDGGVQGKHSHPGIKETVNVRFVPKRWTVDENRSPQLGIKIFV